MPITSGVETFDAFRNPGKGWRPYNFFPVYRSALGQGGPDDYQGSPLCSHLYTGRFAWSEVEPTQGTFVWDPIDAFVAYAQSVGLPVGIAIVGQAKVSAFGFDPLPHWLTNPAGGGLIGGGYWTPGTPDIWEPDYRDPIYLARVQALQNAFAAEYQSNPDWQEAIASYDLRAFGTSGGEWWSGYAWHAQQVATTPALTSSYTGSLPVIFSFDDFEVYDFSGNTLFADDFERTVTDSWNQGDQNTSYTFPTGSLPNFDVAAGVGTEALTAAPTVNTRATLQAYGFDIGFTGVIATDHLASNQQCDFGLRRDNSANNQYRARLTFVSDGTMKVLFQKLVAGVATNIGSTVTLAATYAANDRLRFRFEAQGASPTTLRFRLWHDGSAEPGTWAATQTDSTSVLQANYGDERHDVLHALVDAYVDAFGSGPRPELVMNVVGSHNGAGLAINSRDINAVVHAVEDAGAQMIRRTIGGTFVYPDPTDETDYVAAHLDDSWFAGEWASAGGNISWVKGHSGVGLRKTWEAIDEALAWGASFLGWYKNNESIRCGDIPATLNPSEVPGAASACLRTWDGAAGTVPTDHQNVRYNEDPLSKPVPPEAAHYIGTETLRDYFQRCSGYRFYVAQHEYPARVQRGTSFTLTQLWHQRGVAKLHRKHNLRARLVGATTVTLDADTSSLDAETWPAGPQGPMTVESQFAVPSSTPPGAYELQFAVVGDDGNPAINLANDGKDTSGLSDPLNDPGWYGIGTVLIEAPLPVWGAPTARFDAALAATHTVQTKVEVLESGLVIAEIFPTEGSVSLDGRAEARGHLDLTIVDEELIPTGPDSLLAPYGNELRAWRGIEFPDGTIEGVALGVYRIDDAAVADTGDSLTVSISALDRSQRIAEAGFTDAYTTTPDTLLTDLIESLVREVYPDVEIDFAETGATIPRVSAQAGDDRWAFVQGLATAIGGELYFDGDGVLVLRPVPSASGNPAVTVAEGDGGVLLSAAKDWSREHIYNQVVVTAGDGAIYAMAIDDNPLSPTYFYGKFGPKLYPYESQFITTQAQADDAAQGILQTFLGADQAITFESVVDPRRAPSDVIQITRERIGVNETHVLDAVTIPLGWDGRMSAETRVTQIFT